MAKKKIVLDARMIDFSGIGVYLQNLIEPISRVFSLTLLGDVNKLKPYTESTEIIPCIIPIYSLREQTELPKLIPECDIFWSPHYNVPLTHVKAKYRVVTIHDVFHLAFFKTLNLKQKIYARVVMNKAVHASKAIITVSNFSKQEIVKYTAIPAGKITVIYNGVKSIKSSAGTDALRSKYNLPENYILFVGNVKPHKNLIGLLKAYRLLDAGIRDKVKIVITGKKEGFITGDNLLMAFIENTPELQNNVVFTGFVDDQYLDALYAAAEAFLFPSFYEGFGLPPLEAMLNKCPVAVANGNSLPEVCGDAALYFDPEKPDEIATQLNDIITNNQLRDALVAKGLQRVEQFNWQKSAREHVELFKKILHI